MKDELKIRYHIIFKARNYQMNIVFYFALYIKRMYSFAPFREYSRRDAPRMQLVPWIDTRKKHRGLDQLRGRGLDEQWWVSQFETVACSDHHAMPMMPAHATLVYLVLRPEVEKQYRLPDTEIHFRLIRSDFRTMKVIALRFKYNLSVTVYITHLSRVFFKPLTNN